MRSRRGSNPNLGSFVNMDVAESGHSSESLRSRAVGMVELGLTQGEVVVRLGIARQRLTEVVEDIFEGLNHENKKCSRRPSCAFLRQQGSQNCVPQSSWKIRPKRSQAGNKADTQGLSGVQDTE